MAITKISPSVVDFDDGITITTDDNSNNLTLTSTDADANSGPNLLLKRDNNSAAGDDVTGTIVFQAEDAGNNLTDYIALKTMIQDATGGSEDGRLKLELMSGGTARNILDISGSNAVVFNEDSQDIDFRVESDGNANAIFLNAGDDRVTFFNSATVNAASGTDDGASHYSDGRTDISRASAQPLNLRRRTDDGILQNFYKEASGTVTNVGSISTWSSNIAVGRLNCALLFDDDVNRIKPASVQSSVARDNVIDLGDPSHRFNDVWIGGGIHIGGTGDANKLDDYEEGTWTPTLESYQGNTLNLSSYTSVGTYTKIGRQVTVMIYIHGVTFNSGTNTDYIQITLPFSAHGGSAMVTNSYGAGSLTTTLVDFAHEQSVPSFLTTSKLGFLGSNQDGGVWAWEAYSSLPTSNTAAMRATFTYFVA